MCLILKFKIVVLQSLHNLSDEQTEFLNQEGERACGALIEAGTALASGRQVFVVSPDEWTFSRHPRCRTFPSLERAVEAIVAMQAGELARGLHLRTTA